MKFFQKEVYKPEIDISPFLPEDGAMFKNLFKKIETEEEEVSLLIDKREESEKDGADSI